MSGFESIVQKFANDIDHIWVAYAFFEQLIPDESTHAFPICIGSIEFQKPSHVVSIRVELGWAFFTRLEAALETLVHRLDVGLSKKRSLLDVCDEQGLSLSSSEREGLKVYRELRNLLHHADGDSSAYGRELRHLVVKDGGEPHLEREHVENFYNLFKKVGCSLAASGALP